MRSHFYNSFQIPERKRYTFIGLSAGTIGTAALLGLGGAAAGGAFGDLGGDEEENQIQWREPQWYQTPDYPEATAGRENWAKTLTDWGASGTYGANLPDYNAIFENAKKRINQYYWGGASSPGVIDKIRARGAARGVVDSPAIDVLTQRTGVEEAGKLGDISVGVDTAKAQAIEQARTNWLSSLMNLSQLKPSGTWSTGQAYQQPQQTGFGDVLGTLGQGALQYGLNQSNMSWYTDLLDKYLKPTSTSDWNMPETSQISLTSGYSQDPYDFMNQYRRD